MPRPQKHQALTLSEFQEILQMMDDGVPNAVISRRSRASYHVVRRIAAGQPVSVTSGRSGRRPKVYPFGEGSQSAKLTKAQVVAICKEYAGGKSAIQLSAKYGVSPQLIHSIVTGERRAKETEGHRKSRPRIVRFGEQCHSSKLTWARVRRLRDERKKRGTSYDVLAEKYGITRNAVFKIIKNQTWKEPANGQG